jgi:ABC-type proline/glycine betaine transport system permease subunit
MGAANIKRWIGVGLLGLPLYAALSFYSSLDPQPDPNTHYDAWARYVTTDHYVLSHLFASDIGLILAIFGTFALGVYLSRSRAGRMGLTAMVAAVFGSALFLPVMGISAFAAPKEGQAYLAGIEEYSQLPDILANTMVSSRSRRSSR